MSKRHSTTWCGSSAGSDNSHRGLQAALAAEQEQTATLGITETLTGTEERTARRSHPSASCYERQYYFFREFLQIKKERGGMKGSKDSRLTGVLPAAKAADEGLVYHNPSPTGKGLTSSLMMIGKTPEGNGETIASLIFSCDFRRPQLARQRGQHDDVASNDERKETSSRTGEWRTNKKRHILGALGISFDIILFFFPKLQARLGRQLFFFHRILCLHFVLDNWAGLATMGVSGV
jgi:hypothetical protein